MCGLAGVMIGPQKGDQEIARYLLKELIERVEQRGYHATGVGVYAEGDKPGRIWKVAERASLVLKSPSFNTFIDGLPQNSRIFIGHTRHGTHGANEKNENAHPFQKGRVIGAHNGIIHNYRDLAKNNQMEVPEVDSEVVFQLLDRYKDPTKVLPDVGGYFALTWIKGGKLWMAKSDGADLTLAYVPSLHMLTWASTAWALRGGLEAVGLKQDEWQMYPPKHDMIYRFEADKFDDKGTNRVTVACEFQRRKVFYHRPQSYTTQSSVVTRPYRGEKWDWEEYYGLSDSRQPSLFQESTKAKDRRSSSGKKDSKSTAVVVSGATTGKEPVKAEQKAVELSYEDMKRLMEVLIRDRVRNANLAKTFEDRIQELERQVDMMHDFITSDLAVKPKAKTDCLYCHKKIENEATRVTLPQGDVHYGCLFAPAMPDNTEQQPVAEMAVVTDDAEYPLD